MHNRGPGDGTADGTVDRAGSRPPWARRPATVLAAAGRAAAAGAVATPAAATRRTPSLARLAGIVGLAGLGLVAITATPAAAVPGSAVTEAGTSAARGGGDLLYPARDRYEPGQTVTMLGYGYGYGDPQASWRTTQFHGYLRPADDLDDAFPDFPGPRVGPVVVQEVPPFLGRDLRVSIEFPLPADLAPGEYVLDICDDPCLTPLGWFMPSFLHVGVDPGYPIVRDWPLTDPAIRWLEDDALVAGPSFQPVRAADVRAGRIPAFRPGPPATLPAPDAGATGANAGATAAGQGDTPAPAGNGPAQPESPGDSGTARADADTLTGPAEDDGAAPVPWPAVGLVTAALLATVGVAVRRSRRRPGPDDGAPGPGVVPAPDGAGPPEIELVESAGSDDPVTVGALGGDHGGGRSRVRIHL